MSEVGERETEAAAIAVGLHERLAMQPGFNPEIDDWEQWWQRQVAEVLASAKPDPAVAAVVTDAMLGDLAARAADQWERLTGPPHPADFTYDRNGLRLGIAALEDEVRELHDEWVAGKRTLDNPGVAANLRHEVLDIAAVAMLIYRNIPAPAVVKAGDPE